MPAIVAILVANIMWGASPPIFKFVLQEVPPFTLAFIRFFIAGLIFLPFVIKQIPQVPRSAMKDILIGSIWGITIHISTLFIGLQYAPSINVHMISSLGPIGLYALSLYMLKEKPHQQVLKGMIISIVGISIIIFAPLFKIGAISRSSISLQSQFIGNALFVISTVGIIMLTIYTKRALKYTNTLVITTMHFLVGSMTFLPFMIAELQDWSIASLSAYGFLSILYGIFFATAIAYLLHTYALKKIPAQEIGVYNYIMPIVAVIVAVPLLGEYPDIFFLIGTVIVCIGILISERHPHVQDVHKRMHKKLHKEA